jgi:flavin reductase (DIM6/NTAB) family NADH-FMN oxidoreductase RutF
MADPQQGLERFADAMAELAAGVAVVTVRDDERPGGLLVTSMTAYTAEPPSVLVSVARSSRSHPALSEGREFGVHMLGAHQQGVARRFASKADDKFADLEWSWDGEVPRIAGTLAYLRCETDAVFDHRDHTILIGLVRALAIDDTAVEPLVYWRRELTWRLGPR